MVNAGLYLNMRTTQTLPGDAGLLVNSQLPKGETWSTPSFVEGQTCLIVI